jgi:cob(I)alamin adenosyltransferase
MRIYTKKGDAGSTSLLRGGRVQKDHLRVAAYGDVDELNAAIGIAAAVSPRDFEEQLLETIQRDLFTIGALLAIANDSTDTKADEKMAFDEARVSVLEKAIDTATDSMLPLEKFVLPGGSEKAAMLHVARTVCRRAERSVVTLGREDTIPQLVLPYLNRLSDLLFTLARLANARAGIPDREW